MNFAVPFIQMLESTLRVDGIKEKIKIIKSFIFSFLPNNKKKTQNKFNFYFNLEVYKYWPSKFQFSIC